jgi:hypothetical protein
MKIWKPLTCGCEIELDDLGNWKSTLYKCDLHKNYSGKTLLEEVRKHNREYVPKAEPETIEGTLGFDFEPEWLKEVKKFPSKEKLEETRFNLATMNAYYPIDKEFQYCLSNFLNSSTSVLWYLLEEYSRKYGFDINKYRKDERYKEVHQKLVSTEAETFLSWYNSQFNALKNDKLGFLINKRNDNIHQGYIVLVFKHEQPFKVKGRVSVDIPLDWSMMYAYFPQNKSIKAVELCARFIERLKSIVDQAHERFPL